MNIIIPKDDIILEKLDKTTVNNTPLFLGLIGITIGWLTKQSDIYYWQAGRDNNG